MSRYHRCSRFYSIWSTYLMCSPSTGSRPVTTNLIRMDRSTHVWSLTKQLHPVAPSHTVVQKRGAKSKVAASKKNKEDSTNTTNPSGPLDPTVCNGVNVLKNGSDPPLKPDSEYPEWLWGLIEGAEAPKTPSQLSPDTKQYWRRHNKVKAHDGNELQKQLK